MKHGALYNQCIDYLVVERRRLEETVKTYADELRRFFHFCERENISPLSCQSGDVQHYLMHRSVEFSVKHAERQARRDATAHINTDTSKTHSKNKTLNSNTLRRILSTLRTFYRFCMLENLCKENPLDCMKAPKHERTEPQVLEVEQVALLLESIDTSTAHGLRDRALFELMYACGLRISEAVSLKLANVLLEESLIRVIGKGDKERIIPIGSHAKRWLLTYITTARVHLIKHKVKHDNAVFLNVRGAPISRKGIWKNYKKLLSALSLSAKVHTLRHSCATHLLTQGMDLRMLQELLGHADLSTTQIYTHLADDTLAHAHAKYHPRSNTK